MVSENLIMDSTCLFHGIYVYFPLTMLSALVMMSTTVNGSTSVSVPNYRVATVLNEPWMMRAASGGFEGVLVDLLDEIARLSNFSYTINDPINNTYGDIQYTSNGIQVNGIIGQLITGEADLGVADLMITELRSKVVHFSAPFASSGLHMLLKKPERTERGIGLLLKPFSASLWICILTYFLVKGVVVFMMKRILYKEKDLMDNNSAVLCIKGKSRKPKPLAFQILSVACWCFTVFVLISYTASLVCLLSSTSSTKPVIPFKTFAEMTGQSDVKYGGWHGLPLDVTDGVQRAIDRHSKSHSTHYSDISDAVRKVKDESNDFAAIVDGLTGQKIANEHCDLMMLREQLFGVDYGIACARDTSGEALCLGISQALLTLRDSGTLDSVLKKWLETPTTCEKVSEDDFITTRNAMHSPFKPLSIEDFTVAFILVLVGFIVSLVVARVTKTYKKQGKNSENHSTRCNNHVQTEDTEVTTENELKNPEDKM